MSCHCILHGTQRNRSFFPSVLYTTCAAIHEAESAGIPRGWPVLETDLLASNVMRDGRSFHIRKMKSGESINISNACLAGDKYQLPTSDLIVKSRQKITSLSSFSPFGPKKQISLPVTSSNGGVSSMSDGFKEWTNFPALAMAEWSKDSMVFDGQRHTDSCSGVEWRQVSNGYLAQVCSLMIAFTAEFSLLTVWVLFVLSLKQGEKSTF